MAQALVLGQKLLHGSRAPDPYVLPLRLPPQALTRRSGKERSESRSFCCVTSALLKNRLPERAASLAERQDRLRSGRQPAACGCQLEIPDGQRGHPGTGPGQLG